MGRTFVSMDDNEYGFWANDRSLQVWLYFLIQRTNRMQNIPPWLNELRRIWSINMEILLNGCVRYGLDEIKLGQIEKTQLSEISSLVINDIQSFGSHIPLDILNNIGSGNEWTKSIESKYFIDIGLNFINIIKGEIKTNSNSSRTIG